MQIDPFYHTHYYLVDHLNAPLRRALMDEVDWDAPLIGIKGARGVGKTSFLLQYAKEHFEKNDRRCLYININNFCFSNHTLTEFVQMFKDAGGEVLLIDQIFKHPDWDAELVNCRKKFPEVKIVFTGSSVMRLKSPDCVAGQMAKTYNLRGFSFREYLNLVLNTSIPIYSLEEIIARHEEIAAEITAQIKPLRHFDDYLQHGYYPFFLENRNFGENLLKTMNMMIEVDVLLIKQIDLKYLWKIKQLLYLLWKGIGQTLNVSKLAAEIETSRATVMNYIKYLEDARLLNLVYNCGENFPKKPASILMNNTNLIYALQPEKEDKEHMFETFFANMLWKDHTICQGKSRGTFEVDKQYRVRFTESLRRTKTKPETLVINGNLEKGKNNHIPLWMFGLLY